MIKPPTIPNPPSEHVEVAKAYIANAPQWHRMAEEDRAAFLAKIDQIPGAKEGVYSVSAAQTLASALEWSKYNAARYKAIATALLWEIDEHAQFANGNTDPTGSTDEGEVLHSRFMQSLDQETLKELRQAISVEKFAFPHSQASSLSRPGCVYEVIVWHTLHGQPVRGSGGVFSTIEQALAACEESDQVTEHILDCQHPRDVEKLNPSVEFWVFFPVDGSGGVARNGAFGPFEHSPRSIAVGELWKKIKSGA